MKELYKQLQQQLKFIGNFINWLILFIVRESFKTGIINNKSGKELRIIGNGPSFNLRQAMTKDDNVEYCMINQSCLTPEFNILKPSIYVIADPGYALKNNRNAITLWKRLNDGIDWNMTIYMPYYMFREIKDLDCHCKNIKVSFYHSSCFQGWKKLAHWLYDKNFAIPGAANVLIPSLYIGIIHNYELIRLYGADHSWTEQMRVNKMNQVCVRQIHYYDDEEQVKLEPWNDETGKPFTMMRILERFSSIFGQYEMIEDYAKSRNIKIINMSPDSYIDAFKKE